MSGWEAHILSKPHSLSVIIQKLFTSRYFHHGNTISASNEEYRCVHQLR